MSQRGQLPWSSHVLHSVSAAGVAALFAVGFAGCSRPADRDQQAARDAQHAELRAAQAEAAADRARAAAQQAEIAAARAQKAVEDATREINRVADHLDRINREQGDDE